MAASEGVSCKTRPQRPVRPVEDYDRYTPRVAGPCARIPRMT